VLYGRQYKVDPKLRGMTLSVQCNPFIAHLPKLDAQQPDEVTLFSEQGIYVGKGVYYQRERGAHPPLPVTKEKEPIESAYISALLKEHQRSLEQARQGIDYKTAMAYDHLTLSSLSQLFARLLGRSGGLSSLSSDEMRALETFYANQPQVRSSQVRMAFEQAAGGGFQSVLWLLQQPPTTKGHE